ncbi:MAG: serine carboxypeptidase, partial [Pseudomonadota bacterium]
MVRNFRSAAGVALASLVYAAVAVAAEAVPEAVAKVEMAPPPDVPLPTQFVTNHAGQFNGKELTYQVVAGETYLRDTQGEPKAAVFAFTYLVDDTTASQRPVTFVWNGGPGSASTWLHMGAFGPKRIVVPTDAQHPGPPPYQIEAAPETILDVTDLVYVDPVGTGFSRALGAHEPKEFWGLPEDPQSIAEFIRAWLTEHKRWNSPRFILGESYGTTRAAAVADILEDDMSISLNGVVFVSQALDYQGSTPYARDNLISSVTYLPTLAATAWYHERVTVKEQTLEAFLDAARA